MAPNETQSLADQLRARLQQALDTRSAQVNDAADAMIASLRESELASRVPAIGSPAPHFALPASDGRLIQLDQVLTDGPAIVTFYRGGWCPYCNLELRAYQQLASEFETVGASILAISPELPDYSASTVEDNELSFDVLSDVGNVVARQFGLVFELPEDIISFYLKEKGLDLREVNGTDRWELPVSGTFAIAQDREIILAEADPDYTKRLEPSDILAMLARRAKS